MGDISIETETDADRYYHAYCRACNSEDFLPGDSTIESIQRLHDAVCTADCDGEVYHRVVDERRTALPCERCQERRGAETIGSTRFCAECAADVQEYING